MFQQTQSTILALDQWSKTSNLQKKKKGIQNNKFKFSLQQASNSNEIGNL